MLLSFVSGPVWTACTWCTGLPAGTFTKSREHIKQNRITTRGWNNTHFCSAWGQQPSPVLGGKAEESHLFSDGVFKNVLNLNLFQMCSNLFRAAVKWLKVKMVKTHYCETDITWSAMLSLFKLKRKRQKVMSGCSNKIDLIWWLFHLYQKEIWSQMEPRSSSIK